MAQQLAVVVLIGLVAPLFAAPGKILLLPSAIVPSHKLLFNRLAEELIRRNNTVVSWQVTLKPDSLAVPKGLDHRVITVEVPEGYIRHMYVDENATVYNVNWEDSVTEQSRKAANWAMMRRVCEVLLDTRKADFDALVAEHFDVVVLDDLFNPCGLLFVGLTRIPFVYWSHTHLRTETAWSTHSPSMPSYVPVPGTGLTDDMNFIQRAFNMLSYIKTIYIHQRIILRPLDWLFQAKYPGRNVPEAFYIERNASVNLINTAAVYDFPRPFMPRCFFVGCLLCRKASPLGGELAEFVNGANEAEGFVLFTTGFTIQWKRAPERIVTAFTEAFREMPNLKFVWQYDGPVIANLPKNVYVAPWLPQNDLLGHPKCKGFISHGGINSVQEALWHHVPILGVPIYADHKDYLIRATARGAGFTLDKTFVTKDTLVKAVRKLLKDNKYKTKMTDVSELMRDVPYTELDHAAFWVEFLIRHGEVPFARSGADDLNVIQYFLIDVIAFLLGCAILLCTGCVYCCRYTCRGCRWTCRKICCRGKDASQHSRTAGESGKKRPEEKKAE